MTATSNISSNLQSIKLKYRAGSTFLECLVHLFNWSLRRNVLHRSMLDEKHFSRWKLLCYRLLLSGTKTRKFYVVKFISASHTSFAILFVSKSIPVRWSYTTRFHGPFSFVWLVRILSGRNLKSSYQEWTADNSWHPCSTVRCCSFY